MMMRTALPNHIVLLNPFNTYLVRKLQYVFGVYCSFLLMVLAVALATNGLYIIYIYVVFCGK